MCVVIAESKMKQKVVTLLLWRRQLSHKPFKIKHVDHFASSARPQQQTAATPSAVIWHSASYGATASSATEGPLAAGVTLDELRLEMNDLVQVADNLVRR